MNILDLDPELLLHAIKFLPAKHQAAATQSCKLFAILVHEISRTTSFLASAVGALSSTLLELETRLEAQPTMGIVFSEDNYHTNSTELAAFAANLPYHLELVGGQMEVVAGTNAAGELVQTERRCVTDLPTAALHLGHFPEATCKSFVIDPRQDGSFREQLQAQGCLDDGWKVFLLVSLYDNDTPDLVEVLQGAHPQAAIIGGFASGDSLFRVRHHQVEALDRGLVGLMFKGNVPLAAFVSRGARGLGDGPLTFGAADLEEVRFGDEDEEDGGIAQLLTHLTDAHGKREQALKAIMDVIHSSPHTQGLSMGLAEGADDGYELVPLSNDIVLQEKMAVILPPKRRAAAEGTAAEAAEAAEAAGWRSGALRLYSWGPESCKEDLKGRLTSLKTHCEAKGDRLLGAVMFTCAGRTDRFFGEAAFDASCFVRIMTGVPLIGMYAGGEIGPPLLAEVPASKAFQVGGAGMHGFTAIFGMFVVPERQVCTAQLAFAGGEEGAASIAAAWGEMRASVERIPPQPAAANSSSPMVSGTAMLPATVEELRALPVKDLKAAMLVLGLQVVAGSEKEELVQAMAPHLNCNFGGWAARVEGAGE